MNEKLIEDIRVDALKRNIPILMDVTLEYILNILKNMEIYNILEIGTAVGYSAICFSNALKENGHIDTIEIEEERVVEANQNIQKANLTNVINVIYNDALIEMPKLIEQENKYDYIFIDASKGKYREFYDYALQLLNPNGIIIADNVLYKGMVLSGYNEHKHRTAVTKLRNFIEYAQLLKDYETQLLDIGDGILVSKKIGGKYGRK